MNLKIIILITISIVYINRPFNSLANENKIRFNNLKYRNVDRPRSNIRQGQFALWAAGAHPTASRSPGSHPSHRRRQNCAADRITPPRGHPAPA